MRSTASSRRCAAHRPDTQRPQLLEGPAEYRFGEGGVWRCGTRQSLPAVGQRRVSAADRTGTAAKRGSPPSWTEGRRPRASFLRFLAGPATRDGSSSRQRRSRWLGLPIVGTSIRSRLVSHSSAWLLLPALARSGSRTLLDRFRSCLVSPLGKPNRSNHPVSGDEAYVVVGSWAQRGEGASFLRPFDHLKLHASNRRDEHKFR